MDKKGKEPGADPIGQEELPPISNIKEAVIRIAGNSQDGIQLVGDFLARLSGRVKMEVMTFQTFPATISGGPSVFQLRIGSGKVRSAGDDVDVLVAFYQHSYEAHLKYLKEGGILIYDTAHVSPDKSDKRYRFIGVPMTELTIEAIGGSTRQKGKNMFLMGLIARIFDLDVKKLEKQMQEKFLPRGENVLRTGLNAFYAGYAYSVGGATDQLFTFQPSISTNKKTQVTMNGNQAVAYGAIVAGVRFGAGYPITPWSSIMEILRSELPKFGGVFVQTEDEIAAVAMAVGASYGGNIPITGTSGPGLSLKSEAIGYAVNAEIGIVVVDVQRGGPSTGLPTKVEQSDLNLALFGGHGDCPRIVMAPASVEDTFYSIIEAVNLAKEYNVPVIFLTDQSLATRIEAWEEPALADIIQDISPVFATLRGQVLPYENTESAISQRPVPGTRIIDGSYPVISGLEHNEAGHPDGTPENHMIMNAKRRRKLQTLAAKLPLPEVYGPEAGEVLLVGWGSTEGPIQEAVDRARSEDEEISSIHLKYLSPLPNGIEKIFENFDHVFVVEMNDEGLYGYGQLAAVLRARYVTGKIRGINKTDGLPFKVKEILSKAREYLTKGIITGELTKVSDFEQM